MRRINILYRLLLLLMVNTIFSAYADTPYVELVAIDNNGEMFTIEIFKSERSQNKIDVVIYQNSNPAEKIHGTGTGFRDFYYVNTDTPLFDITFQNGDLKKLQPFKKIMYIYNNYGDSFIAPKDTKDPGWRIPYIVYKKDGVVITPITSLSNPENASNCKPNSPLNLYDFLETNMEIRSVSDIFKQLKLKDFSMGESNGITSFKKDGISIYYYFEEMNASDSFNISFPSVKDAEKFISIITDDERWVPQTNYFGKTIGYKFNRVTISYDFDNFSDVTIIGER
ncbi:MAG: hypothetical protein HDR74_02215 [Bacteroides sp.]|nr:hypothetical protein [Bacteroides sp.]